MRWHVLVHLPLVLAAYLDPFLVWYLREEPSVQLLDGEEGEVAILEDHTRTPLHPAQLVQIWDSECRGRGENVMWCVCASCVCVCVCGGVCA